MDSYANYKIDIPFGRTSGQIYTICPQCSEDRKKKNAKCLGVNLDKKIWHCVHCGWKGHLKDFEKKIYTRPTNKTNNTHLSDRVLKWFESRGIGQQTLIETKISEGIEWMPISQKEVNTIRFNYFKDGELINIKYRSADKGFKLVKDAELIFYNLDCVKNSDSIYIVEGEMDALSLIECGIKNVVSVPNGANKNQNNLQYIDNCIDYFQNIKEIYLATDSDIAGRNLQEEVSIRFGKEKCFKIDFKECKDANEFLLKYGKIELEEILNKKIPYPLEGIYTIRDISDKIDDVYDNGLEKGALLGLDLHDKSCSWVKGYMTIITGIPSHGKSEYLDFILIRLNLLYNWKGGLFSPENRPLEVHFSKMAEKLIGKSFQGQYRMTKEEKNEAKNFLNEKVWFIKPKENFTLDNILEYVKKLVQRYGIDYFVIDAWNKLEHKYEGESETKYIGSSLDKILTFCDTNKIHCFLIAHPKKMNKDKTTGLYEVPTLYDIAGSYNFFAKADIGISVYRDFDKEETTINFPKVKYKHWGMAETITFKYQIESGRYYEKETIPDLSNWIYSSPKIKQTSFQPLISYSESIKEQTNEEDLPFLSQ